MNSHKNLKKKVPDIPLKTHFSTRTGQSCDLNRKEETSVFLE